MGKSQIKPALGLLTVLYIMMQWVLAPGCANVIPPTGGPRDSFPPILLKSIPENNTTRFKSTTINLQFDEYVELNNLQEQLIINPPPDRQPEIIARLRNLTIKIKDTLQPNTTYSFRFGDAIRDINEGNLFKDFNYVLSTGSYIDSLTLAGTVTDAQSGMPDSTLMILLHRSADDSAVAKEKPVFVTRANGKGRFRFENLPAGTFYVFALKDEGFRRYGSPKTPFAFHDSVVMLPGYNDSVRLRAFVAEKETPRKPGTESAGNGTATSGTPKKVEKIMRIILGVSETQPQDLLTPLYIQFSLPLKKYDSTKLILSDTLDAKMKDYTFTVDSTAKQLSLNHKWKDDAYYKLIIQKGFAIDSADLQNNKNDTVFFKTKAESEYGAVKVSFTGIDLQKNPVLQWVENDVVTQSTPLTSAKLSVALVKPGEYKFRILYDSNKNGIWDTGNYWKKLQPEMVIAIEQKIVIRANWENEFEIEL